MRFYEVRQFTVPGVRFNEAVPNTDPATGRPKPVTATPQKPAPATPQKPAPAASSAVKKKKPLPAVVPISHKKIVDKKLENTSLGSYIEDVARKNQIVGVHLANFLAQCKVETAGWQSLAEWADGKKYDITVDPANATKLGNTQPGDGPKYKGRGFIHLTGRWNYAECGKALGIDLIKHPELLETNTEIAAKSALWFWNRFIRPNYKANDVHGISKRVNGTNPNGMTARINAFNEYIKILKTPITRINPGHSLRVEVDPADPVTQLAAGEEPEQTVA